MRNNQQEIDIVTSTQEIFIEENQKSDKDDSEGSIEAGILFYTLFYVVDDMNTVEEESIFKENTGGFTYKLSVLILKYIYQFCRDRASR